MRGGCSITKHVRCDYSSKQPNRSYQSLKLLIQLLRSTGEESKKGEVPICEFESAGQEFVCVCVYVLRTYEGGGVWLFGGDPTGLSTQAWSQKKTPLGYYLAVERPL